MKASLVVSVVGILSLLSGSVASAEETAFAASEYPAHVVTTPDAAFAVTSAIGKITCVSSEEDESLEATALLEEEQTQLTLEDLGYADCHATVLQLPITVETNGCHYTLQSGAEESATTAEGSTEIECPGEAGIEFKIFTGSTKHAEGEPGCIVDLPEQASASGSVAYHDIVEEENGKSAVTVELAELEMTTVRTAVGGLCTTGIDSSGITGSFIAHATGPIGIAAVGAPTPAETAFAASEYSAHVVTSEASVVSFTTSTGPLTCSTGEESQSFEWTGVIEERVADLTAENVQFAGCHATALKYPVTVAMNGCQYLFSAGVNESPTTAEGSTQIECPGEAGIEFKIFTGSTKHAEGIPGCVLHVPAQSPSAGTVEYHNTEDESGKGTIAVELYGLTLQVSRTEGILCSGGTDQIALSVSFTIEAPKGADVEVDGA